jgi:hypothetical protein
MTVFQGLNDEAGVKLRGRKYENAIQAAHNKRNPHTGLPPFLTRQRHKSTYA